MEKRIVDINSINKILHNFYSYKLSIAVPKMFNNHVFLIGRLYEAFEFKCGIDPDEHNSFHFSIRQIFWRKWVQPTDREKYCRDFGSRRPVL